MKLTELCWAKQHTRETSMLCACSSSGVRRWIHEIGGVGHRFTQVCQPGHLEVSNFQLIIDALADFTKMTGIDLSENHFAAMLEQSNSPSPETILQL